MTLRSPVGFFIPALLFLSLWTALPVQAQLWPFGKNKKKQQAEAAKAQSKRDSYWDKLLEFDPEKKFQFRDEDGAFIKEFKAPDAEVKPFFYEQLFIEKEFSTKEFRSPDYQTDSFRTTVDSESGQAREVREVAAETESEAYIKQTVDRLIEEAPEASGEAYNTRDSPEAGRDAARDAEKAFAETDKYTRVEGKNQEELDRQVPDRPALNVEDIRQLLNKN